MWLLQYSRIRKGERAHTVATLYKKGPTIDSHKLYDQGNLLRGRIEGQGVKGTWEKKEAPHPGNCFNFVLAESQERQQNWINQTSYNIASRETILFVFFYGYLK